MSLKTYLTNDEYFQQYRELTQHSNQSVFDLMFTAIRCMNRLADSSVDCIGGLAYNQRTALGRVIGFTTLSLHRVGVKIEDLIFLPEGMKETAMDRVYDSRGFKAVWMLGLYSLVDIQKHLADTASMEPGDEVDHSIISDSVSDLMYVFDTITKKNSTTVTVCLDWSIEHLKG